MLLSGNGSYDESTGKYTHKINSIKDVYITLSYEDLKGSIVEMMINSNKAIAIDFSNYNLEINILRI